jgi:hypothetical protein
MGRELYLNRLLNSARQTFLGVEFEWKIVLQGQSPSLDMIKTLEHEENVSYVIQEKPLPVSVLLNQFARGCKYPFVLKLDDDALICSSDFLYKYAELTELIPDSVIYPFEIGGYTHEAPMNKRQVVYAPKNNLFFSVAVATAPSGLASLYPKSFLLKTPIPSGQIDAEFLFSHAGYFKVPVYQLQNGLVVEHQEGIEGQEYRKQLPDGQTW